MSCIEVVRVANVMSRERWRFWFDERSHCLVLDGYVDERRETKRHKFSAVAVYDRLSNRHRVEPTKLTMASVPLPDDVKAEACSLFTAGLRVVKDYQR